MQKTTLSKQIQSIKSISRPMLTTYQEYDTFYFLHSQFKATLNNFTKVGIIISLFLQYQMYLFGKSDFVFVIYDIITIKHISTTMEK